MRASEFLKRVGVGCSRRGRLFFYAAFCAVREQRQKQEEDTEAVVSKKGAEVNKSRPSQSCVEPVK